MARDAAQRHAAGDARVRGARGATRGRARRGRQSQILNIEFARGGGRDGSRRCATARRGRRSRARRPRCDAGSRAARETKSNPKHRICARKGTRRDATRRDATRRDATRGHTMRREGVRGRAESRVRGPRCRARRGRQSQILNIEFARGRGTRWLATRRCATRHVPPGIGRCVGGPLDLRGSSLRLGGVWLSGLPAPC
jgi:hypothetical protein